MVNQKATNVTRHEGDVSSADRRALLGQSGSTLWFTGLSGSGKSTIAVALESALMSQNKLSYRLDGDNVRLGINKNLGFSGADRAENIRRVGEIAKLFNEAGVITLASFISPYREDRNQVRRIHQEMGLAFVEIFVDCDLASAESVTPRAFIKKPAPERLKTLLVLMTPMKRQTILSCI